MKRKWVDIKGRDEENRKGGEKEYDKKTRQKKVTVYVIAIQKIVTLQGIICNDLSLRVTRALLPVNTRCTANFRFTFNILQSRKLNGFTQGS
jgi:predicted ATP-grasp superfamily ATP-dependent carboligase